MHRTSLFAVLVFSVLALGVLAERFLGTPTRDTAEPSNWASLSAFADVDLVDQLAGDAASAEALEAPPIVDLPSVESAVSTSSPAPVMALSFTFLAPIIGGFLKSKIAGTAATVLEGVLEKELASKGPLDAIAAVKQSLESHIPDPGERAAADAVFDDLGKLGLAVLHHEFGLDPAKAGN